MPRTYDRKIFHLDGRMELEISFQGKTMKTMVYIKMDAPDQLLLSEGVCRQLGIVSYHPSLTTPDRMQTMLPNQTQPVPSDQAQTNAPKSESLKPTNATAHVPCVLVSLVQSLKLPPSRSAVVSGKLGGQLSLKDQAVFVKGCTKLKEDTGLVVEEAVLPPPEDGLTRFGSD